MTAPNWKALAPHRPLPAGDATYVAPPSAVGKNIADWILAGGETVLLGGPTGVGKSTELAHAAALLAEKRLACLVQVDRWENMRRVTADRILLRVGSLIVAANEHAVSEQIQHLLDDDEVRNFNATQLLHLFINQSVRLAGKPITLLIDGLEKLPEGPVAAEVFAELGALPVDTEIVVVVPWHAAFGSRGDALVRAGERFISMRAVERGGVGLEFMVSLLAARLGISDIEQLVSATEEADHYSGGLPRVFLQLMSDAATYAQMQRGEVWPISVDLATAVDELRESWKRALLPGDPLLIRSADGTDGIELALGARIRLMAHGLLLERSDGNQVTLHAHPLIRPFF